MGRHTNGAGRPPSWENTQKCEECLPGRAQEEASESQALSRRPGHLFPGTVPFFLFRLPFLFLFPNFLKYESSLSYGVPRSALTGHHPSEAVKPVRERQPDASQAHPGNTTPSWKASSDVPPDYGQIVSRNGGAVSVPLQAWGYCCVMLSHWAPWECANSPSPTGAIPGCLRQRTTDKDHYFS